MRQFIGRFVPERFKSPLRDLYYTLEYSVGVRTGRYTEGAPPEYLHDVGPGDYIKIGDEFLRYFIDCGGLRPHERVLDVGSGTGRMARPLTKYLRGGSYQGFDVVPQSIRWCQKFITSKYPNFRFQVADIHNQYYNPTGKYQAAEYRFPFGEASFDFVLLTSVFTHMLPEATENYLREIARVLKPKGRCLITYFLLNSEVNRLIEEGRGVYSFKFGLPNYRVEDRRIPEAAVGYEEAFIRDLYSKYHLSITQTHYGQWCGREKFVGWQDLVVAGRQDPNT